ncbi:MAG: CBS domain-containing protein [Candidatus Hadarchaeales archaeon]
MKVSQIMSSPVLTVSKDSTLDRAMEIMVRERISRLVVVDGAKIVGVLTEKDMVRELGSVQTSRLPLSKIHVSSAMTENPTTVAPDIMAKRAAELMLDHDVSGLPVVEEGRMVGIVTKMDFAKVCFEYGDVYAGEIMQSSPLTTSLTDRVMHVRRVLMEEDVLALPVIVDKRVAGIVTMRDVAKALAAFHDVVPDQYKSERIKNLVVEDAMTRPAICARTDDPVSKAAKLMFERRFSALPVVNLENELVGMLTKTELTELARERL